MAIKTIRIMLNMIYKKMLIYLIALLNRNHINTIPL